MCTALLVGLDTVLTFGHKNGFLASLGINPDMITFILEKLPEPSVSIAAGAIAAAVVAGLRAFSQGTRLREESERYNWYGAAVTEILQDFDKASTDQERFSALLHLETAAYRETRAFIHSHQSAKFLVD